MRLFLLACLSGFILLLSGCNGAADGSSLVPTPTPTPTPAPTPIPTGDNVMAVTVDAGPGNLSSLSLNVPTVSVTICAPGTAQCVTVDHILVDTASTGLRLMASALGNVNSILPQATVPGASTTPLVECYKFADGFIWGPVKTVDATFGGKTVSNLSIQVIGDSTYANTVPTGCSSGGSPENDVNSFGSNGVLGIGNIIHDCESLCTSPTSPYLEDFYYGCSVPGNCIATAVPLVAQIMNPVSLFASDNNGVAMTMQTVPATGASTAAGFLIFGIGTQSNNALGSATVYPIDANGLLNMSYQSKTYSNSFLDSGSNLLFMPSATGIAICTGTLPGFLCPTNAIAANVTVTGINGTPSNIVGLSIGNAQTLLGSNSFTAFNNVGGNNGTGGIDLGMPFNYGRTVFTAFNGASTSAGSGPFVAF
ncbi:DUF3443 family protein [Silvimonas soli]|uniref:DUF3443 family protein n=1 Tax=Silvimonas soli TaxID=2980100 RepID=UPI0024B38BEF|nr:DUF3443 family protein [Silvimonas soli]